MFHKVATFIDQFKEVEAYMHQSKNILKQAEESLMKKNPSTNYKIKIL